MNNGDLGSTKFIKGADVQVEQAWNELGCTGDPSIIVAVLDEGVAVNHPDLKASMWVNEGEIYGSHKDNDGNGYIGDRHGYNFVQETGVISTDSHPTFSSSVALLFSCCQSFPASVSFPLSWLFTSGGQSIRICVQSRFSPVRLFVTLWTIALQAPLSMGFSTQEYWNQF